MHGHSPYMGCGAESSGFESHLRLKIVPHPSPERAIGPCNRAQECEVVVLMHGRNGTADLSLTKRTLCL